MSNTNSQSALKMAVVTTKPRYICVSCFFHHVSQGCVTVYHKCSQKEITLTTSYLSIKETQLQATACYLVDPGCYWISVFGVQPNGNMDEHLINLTKLIVVGKYWI